jgi:biotin carboxyl carrier protein
MYQVKINDAESVEVILNKDEIILNNEKMQIDLSKISEKQFHVLHQNKSYLAEIVSVNEEEKIVQIRINNNIYQASLKNNLDILLAKMGMNNVASSKANDLKAPMPGLVLKIMVEENQVVKKGDSLLILEAMKMENVLKAAGDGIIKSIKVKQRQAVEKGQLLIQIQ